MEQINKVTLRGIVGNLNISEAQGVKMGRFNVCTNRVFKSRSGEVVMESTWIPVVAFENSKVKFDDIVRGSKIEVAGRIRNIAYTASDGTQHSSLDVFAESITLYD